MHSHAVQFDRPAVAYAYDSDGAQAVASRRRLLALAQRQHDWVAGAHLPFPGIGHVRQRGAHTPPRYRWIAAEFGPIDPP